MIISLVVVSRKERSLGKSVIPIEDFLLEK